MKVETSLLTMLECDGISRCYGRSECTEPFRSVTDEHKLNARAELCIRAYNYPNVPAKDAGTFYISHPVAYTM